MVGPKKRGTRFEYRVAYVFEDFGKAVGKVVRKDHVRTDEHWKEGKIERNKRE